MDQVFQSICDINVKPVHSTAKEANSASCSLLYISCKEEFNEIASYIPLFTSKLRLSAALVAKIVDRYAWRVVVYLPCRKHSATDKTKYLPTAAAEFQQ